MLLVFHTLFLISITHAYTALSDSFLQSITSPDADFNPENGTLLSPILRPRVPGTAGHSAVQHHFVDWFSDELPRWRMEWYNSTSTTAAGAEVPISNLVFQREPPWTKTGQANWLTLAAHYDSKNVPEGFVGAMDSAVPCAILMHVARSIDRYVTQMHDEMDALGEGGTVPMDMGIQIMFLDGKDSFDGEAPALYGSRALTKNWEMKSNLMPLRYPNALSQVSMFVLLDVLGSANPTIPSYFPTTHWLHRNIANLETRMRKINVLESRPSSAFIPQSNDILPQSEPVDDYVPFMERGVPCFHLMPSSLPSNRHTINDDGEHLDMPTVRDWAKIVTGLVMEWLDMMEVWPE
ncbi:uncharacterized protein LY89DRAFT_683674 [Mollisia scopiformis]|uniref:Peptide hydrolase n=1 Tax=Mollisia scopiformis TaxID=149040 RepID=A0A194XF76_MOLSC|nr:uncharacterized protein LY89DRAFT_683674 [Mollisia scopiformis]KUJ18801.1 hypothetical protein LY89DRAFT_683674 [Mollisia scopiformis]